MFCEIKSENIFGTYKYMLKYEIIFVRNKIDFFFKPGIKPGDV